MKPAIAAILAAAAASACAPAGPPPARATLDCPQTEGGLTRASISADRKTCIYRADGGVEVKLRLIPTGGRPEQALAQIEAELLNTPVPARPAAAAAAAHPEADAVARQARADAASSAAPESPASDASEEVHIDVPGLRVTANGDDAKVEIGSVKVDASGDDATVRVVRDVRLKGESLSPKKRGLRATFVKAEDRPEGERVVGYEAAGPKAGPLTVATAVGDGDLDDLRKDVERLVRRNGGV
ncbi:hypothetical protein [Phenylobacterium sp.]|jgi:hypothetical protein|uniref:hypothetical protein n=1 Tax=Phenylobacterium sp. TaxID=1871053 RepID=UPI003783DCBF